MIYHNLYKQANKKNGVLAGIIGTGHYGTAVVTQSVYNYYLKIPIIADSNIENARKAFTRAGLTDEQIVVCDSAVEAKKAIESGKYVVVEDPMILMELPLDVIVESTGIAKVGAQYGLAAIENGKHVAMINKETDSTVGPILQYLANEKGLVYTQVDGDQHGLLTGLLFWAKSLGLEIVAAGKSRDVENVYDRKTGEVLCEADYVTLFENKTSHLNEEEVALFDELPYGKVAETMHKRKELLNNMPSAEGYDLCELVIAANLTGLAPDISSTHNPIVRISEIPQVLCPEGEGGILSGKGKIDVISVFRDKFEAGMGGGVFIVVSCENDYSRMILTTKGLISNKSGKSSLILRPHHLCGVETSTSIICAGLLGVSTGSDNYKPDWDIVQTTKVDLKAGYVFGDDHDPNCKISIAPASAMGSGNPAPAHMIQYCKLLRDIPVGTVVTYDMVEKPEDSVLWDLREKQDKVFLK